MTTPPISYFITFHTYGTWLHGDDRGSIDRRHCTYGTPMLPPSAGLHSAMRRRLSQPPITLTTERRLAVEQSVREVCQQGGYPRRTPIDARFPRVLET
jgi:hypothetical protein